MAGDIIDGGKHSKPEYTSKNLADNSYCIYCNQFYRDMA